MFAMCIDRANEMQEHMEHRSNPGREELRNRFFRLMASLALSEAEESDGIRQTHYMSSTLCTDEAMESASWTRSIRDELAKISHQLVSS